MLKITPEIQAKMDATQAAQAADDSIGMKALNAFAPGALIDVWAPVPDKVVGPFKVRRFVEGDFILLAQIGHKLNSFSEVIPWLDKPEPSGPDAWLIAWVMTHTRAEGKEAVKNPEGLRAAATAMCEEMSGMQMALIRFAIVEQLMVYLGSKLDLKQNPVEEKEGASPPPLSPPLPTV